MGLGLQAGFAIKKISEYSEFKNYKTVMEYGCQTISLTAYPLIKRYIFPNLNINFQASMYRQANCMTYLISIIIQWTQMVNTIH